MSQVGFTPDGNKVVALNFDTVYLNNRYECFNGAGSFVKILILKSSDGSFLRGRGYYP